VSTNDDDKLDYLFVALCLLGIVVAVVIAMWSEVI
jgi:hypothetical protein